MNRRINGQDTHDLSSTLLEYFSVIKEGELVLESRQNTKAAKNEAETEALVRDGETMVLGGIYVVDTGKQNTKFPFLSDIPLLGTAFRSNSINDERRELLIFVTPRIVQSPSADL